MFPLSNWTEYDIWSYIGAEDIPLPAIYFSIAGRCSAATECCWRFTNTCSRRPVKTSSRRTSDSDRRRRDVHRLRRVDGDIGRRGDRGNRLFPAHRTRCDPADDRISEAGMEDRKRRATSDG